MASHGSSVHKLGPDKLEGYLKDCYALSKRGPRTSTPQKVLELMGAYSSSQSVIACVKRVLEGHMIHVKPEPGGTGEITQCIASTPEISHDATLEVGSQQPDAPREVQLSTMAHPYVPRGRGATSELLKAAGLVHSFVGIKLCLLSRMYLRLRDAPHGERTLSARHIHRYISYGLDQSPFGQKEEGVLSNAEMARQFEDKVKPLIMPNSLKNHANSILDLIRLCTTDKGMKDLFPPTKRQCLNKAQLEWQRIKRDAEKKSRSVQRRKILTTPEIDAPVYLILCYLNQVLTSGEVDTCLEAVRRGNATQEQVGSIICAISTLFALHGQRRCVAENMTVTELEKAERYHGKFIVRCEKHKTSVASGPANMALKEHQYQLMLTYAQARGVNSQGNLPLLRTPAGRLPGKQFGPLNQFLRARMRFTGTITHNSIRKTIETNKRFAGGGVSSQQCDSIHTYLTHGRNVTKSFYEFQTGPIVCEGAKQVENVLFQVAVFQAIESDALRGLLPASALGKLNYPNRLI